jgi:hypothetical protein
VAGAIRSQPGFEETGAVIQRASGSQKKNGGFAAKETHFLLTLAG